MNWYIYVRVPAKAIGLRLKDLDAVQEVFQAAKDLGLTIKSYAMIPVSKDGPDKNLPWYVQVECREQEIFHKCDSQPSQDELEILKAKVSILGFDVNIRMLSDSAIVGVTIKEAGGLS
jgi:hypothetical protein